MSEVNLSETREAPKPKPKKAKTVELVTQRTQQEAVVDLVEAGDVNTFEPLPGNRVLVVNNTKGAVTVDFIRNDVKPEIEQEMSQEIPAGDLAVICTKSQTWQYFNSFTVSTTKGVRVAVIR